MRRNNKQDPVFFSLHIRVISKYIVWDIIAGTFIFIGVQRYSHSHLIALCSSIIATEGVNLVLKKSVTGRKLIKY